MDSGLSNRDIVHLFRNVAAAYTLKNVNRFRILAYERAADAIEHLTVELHDVWEEKKLEEIPGIGSSIASSLDELFKTGKVKHFEAIMKGIPKAMFPLLQIPGFGPKRAFKLVKTLDLNSQKTVFADLANAIKKGKVDGIEGFGHKSAQDILVRLNEFKAGTTKNTRMVLPYAYDLAQTILAHIKKHPDVIEAETLGSLRRMVATIGDIDIAVASNKPDEVLEWFTKYSGTQRILEKGPSTASILVVGGRHVDLMVQPPERFGALLQHFTGSKAHNIRLREYAIKTGLSLSERGIKSQKTGKLTELKNERDFYGALGMDWIPPELREDQGEIELALEHSLPKVVALEDIKGDLHIHSNYDLKPSHDLGASPVETLLKNAHSLNYQYIGISDHNPSTGNHTKLQIIDIMKRRKDYFDKINYSTKSTRVHFFLMLEIDIMPTGKLALPDEAFDYIDSGIASIHSSFTMSKDAMTKRVLSALSHPKIKILGHPTGRLLEKREGFELDWDQIFSLCKAKNKALEINAWPERLDLSDRVVKDAVDNGVKLCIDTDSHQKDQMINMHYGVSVARRGWAKPSDILNTLPYNGFRKWLLK